MPMSLVFLQVFSSPFTVTIVRPLSSQRPALGPLPGLMAYLFSSSCGSYARHIDGLRWRDVWRIASVITCLRDGSSCRAV